MVVAQNHYIFHMFVRVLRDRSVVSPVHSSLVTASHQMRFCVSTKVGG